MSTIPLPNPYHHDYGDDVASAPFAGRSAAFARLYQHLARSDRSTALCILGRRHIGKSALLHAIRAVFNDSHLTVYVPLGDAMVESPLDWYLTLAQHATAAQVEAGYTITRLSALNPPEGDPAGWFSGDFLPALLAGLRGTRRVLFVLDDADQWLAAVRAGKLPVSSFGEMGKILTEFPAVDLVIALDTAYESDLPAFAPLISIADVVRISNLTLEDIAWVLREPARGHYAVSDEAVSAVFRATGGMPGLTQQFGYLMFRKWSNSTEALTFTAEDVKTMIPTVYTYGERDFTELWGTLTPEERLVLTAVSSINYADPISPASAQRIESWLVETDYPQDIVTIHSALRGLEYREAVNYRAEGAEINGDLLQSWLLDHARLGERGTRSSAGGRGREQDRKARVDITARLSDRQKPARGSDRANSVRLILLFALALMISTAILIAMLAGSPPPLPNIPVEPTATLFIEPTPSG